MVAATSFVASGLAFMPETHQLQKEDAFSLLDIEIQMAHNDQSMLVTEDEKLRENDEFLSQINTMSEIDENIMIDEVIETRNSINLLQNSGSASDSLVRHNMLDRVLADEFDRIEVESYFANDLLQNDELFSQISTTTRYDLKSDTTLQRGNLRRRA